MTEIQNNQSEEATQNSPSVFADYARYYDLLYRDKGYAAEAEYVAGLIRKFHPSARSILELGSGTGIHASLPAEKGLFLTVDGEKIPVARPESLIKMKELSNRPQDLLDIAALKEALNDQSAPPPKA